jgi:hypothetical protein
MSFWIRIIHRSGRVTAVYRLNGKTYVEVKPFSSQIWATIREKIESLNAVAVLAE